MQAFYWAQGMKTSHEKEVLKLDLTDKAQVAAAIRLQNKKRRKAKKPPKKSVKECRSQLIKVLYQRHKYNAKSRGIFFGLILDDVEKLFAECGGMCSVTRLPLNTMARSSSGKLHPLAPSIDRINSDLGYTVENSRIVCLAANVAMNHWGEDILFLMLRSMFKQEVMALELENSRLKYELVRAAKACMPVATT